MLAIIRVIVTLVVVGFLWGQVFSQEISDSKPGRDGNSPMYMGGFD